MIRAFGLNLLYTESQTAKQSAKACKHEEASSTQLRCRCVSQKKTSSSAIAKRPRDASCLSVVSFPAVWNSLPDKLRDPSLSIDSFRRQLKTFLFVDQEQCTQRIRDFLLMRYINLRLLTYLLRQYKTSSRVFYCQLRMATDLSLRARKCAVLLSLA